MRRALVVADEVRQPADQGDRPPGQLGLHQVGRRGELVGHAPRPSPAGRCRTGRAARRSPRPRGRPRRRSPRRSGPSATPGRGCRTRRRRPRPGALPDAVAQRAALASGSTGSSRTCPGTTLELSTPAAASTRPLPVADDPGRAAPGQRVHGGGADRGLALGGGHGPALGLAHDLRRHDEDVAVAQGPVVGRVDRGDDRRDRSSPGATSRCRQPDDAARRERGRRSRADLRDRARTNAAVASGPAHDQVVDERRQPVGLEAGRRAASPASTTQASSTPSAARAP